MASARMRADTSSLSERCLYAIHHCYLVRGAKELYIPDTIQSREYSRDSGADGFSHIRGERERQPELPVPQHGRQAVGPELELGRERLQPERAFRALRQLAIRGNRRCLAGQLRLVSRRSHPPSILPASLSCSEIRTYFLLSSALISQATCRKNLAMSSFIAARSTYGSFFSLVRKLAMKIASTVSTSEESIFPPSV